MHQSDLDALQRLFDMKSNGIVTEAEYELKTFEILGSDTLQREAPAAVASDQNLAHGVSLLVGAALLFLITFGLLSDDHSPKADLGKALGAIFLFALWLARHSIWLISKQGANVVLPIIALGVNGVCALSYVGSL
jgi:hypothetical protein